MLVHLQYPYGLLALIALALLFYRPPWGLALLVAIFPMDPWGPRLPVPGVNTETILVGVAFAVTVLRHGARLPPLRYSGPVIAFIAVMLMAFLVSVPWARGLQTAEGDPAIWMIFKTWKSIVFTALLFFVAYWWSPAPADRERMLTALCVGLFLSSLAGVLDFAFGLHPRSEGRAVGFVGDPNAMAESIGSMMFVPLFLLFDGRARSAAKRAFFAGTYALAGLAIVLSLSRGNWIALLASHFVYLLLVNRALLGGAVVATALVATLGFPLLPKIVRERILSTRETGRVVYQVPLAVNLESSAASRVVFARIGLDMFERSPLWGHGLHAFNYRTPEFGAKYGVLRPKDPHNIAVKLAADAGVIGLGVLAWIVWAVFRCGRRLWRADSPEHLLGAVLLACATYVLVSNLSATSFLYAKQISAQFWILYAVGSSLDRARGGAGGQRRCRCSCPGGAGSPRGRRPRCPSRMRADQRAPGLASAAPRGVGEQRQDRAGERLRAVRQQRVYAGLEPVEALAGGRADDHRLAHRQPRLELVLHARAEAQRARDHRGARQVGAHVVDEAGHEHAPPVVEAAQAFGRLRPDQRQHRVGPLAPHARHDLARQVQRGVGVGREGHVSEEHDLGRGLDHAGYARGVEVLGVAAVDHVHDRASGRCASRAMSGSSSAPRRRPSGTPSARSGAGSAAPGAAWCARRASARSPAMRRSSARQGASTTSKTQARRSSGGTYCSDSSAQA
jgi:hypothetical protein